MVDNFQQGNKVFRSVETDDVHIPVVATQQSLASTPELTGAAIATTGSGDKTIIAAGGAGILTKVHRLYFTVDGATTITIKRGSTALTGAIVLAAAGSSFFLDFSSEPWFTTAANETFVINTSAAVAMAGRVEYKQDAE